ncbi:hypothetical protein FB45DRAFT_754916 [Roridomyces roridus]|uniref:SH3 domain-containing protein n=1 Tax=Roridomyces roridus TaxID=1738132 RepID=A0AAD7FEJ1_9AGAR|nr:hypothetical protein FB45DRAFT_754916 [Roridomyces roridus]
MPEEARVHRISPPATPQSPRSHSPELLRPQFHTHIPSVDVQPEESIRKATVRARALYDCKSVHFFPEKCSKHLLVIAAPDDPDEISFCKGDVLDIIDEQGKWWLVQDAVGSLGIVPSNYLEII